MPLQRKLSYALVALTALGIAAVIAFTANPGRPAIAVLFGGAACWFVTARIAHDRHCAVMRQAAADLGLAYLATPADEKASEFLSKTKLTAEADVYRWKVDGKLPALVGERAGCPVVVRVPVGVDFDAGAPDSTRIVAYQPSKMTGFTVYDRSRVKKTPKGRQAPTGDAAFDERFLVMALRAEEAKTVLGPEVRKLLLAAGGVGFRGIEVNRYGIFLHEEGKVSSAELLGKRLELVIALAVAARELARPA